ncbi:hypothetical protein [Brevundimonas sp. DC300-4]|uniref:hypothetical protein n=1 Tax=Brevundimonas sp. DC300-4 TaxID=2804594 RepID=UPI003CF72652
MTTNTVSGRRPLTAVLHQMHTEGLIRTYVDDHGHLRWTITQLGKTFQSLVAEHAEEEPISSRFDVGAGATVGDVVSPDQAGKLVVDIGPAVRIHFTGGEVPDYIELGLLTLVVGDPPVLEEVTPCYPQRVSLDIGMAWTRPRSKITKAEFEVVGRSVEFVGIFDRQGRLCCYSALVQWGDGGCRAPRWTVVPVSAHEGEEQ